MKQSPGVVPGAFFYRLEPAGRTIWGFVMTTGLLKALSYVAVIALGYALKRAGFFGRDDHRLLSRIMLNVTLPCAVVQAFDGFSGEGKLFLIVGIGLAASLAPVLLMYLVTGGTQTRLRAYRMLSAGGSNVGCFSMPLIGAIFGSMGMVTASLFDVGNAIVMTGGSYAITSALLRTGGRREGAKDIALRFVKSVPFDTYMLMLALAALRLPVPGPLLELTRPAGQANGFIAMLTIGAMFEPVMDGAMLRETARELAFRYGVAAVFALGCFFLTPFEPGVRRVLAVLCLSPISSLAPVYTDRIGADAALASFTNSASIVISLALMIAVSSLPAL